MKTKSCLYLHKFLFIIERCLFVRSGMPRKNKTVQSTARSTALHWSIDYLVEKNTCKNVITCALCVELHHSI
jgi:Uri superfamily endonuclease